MSYKSNKAWRKEYPLKWQLTKQRYYKQFQKNAHNRGRIWSLFDVAIVMGKFDTDRNLSKQLGRSVKAIQCLRVRMKGG